jgi:hypothetical protein
MNMLLAALVAGFLAVSTTAALAADAKKDAAPVAAKNAEVKLEKPASISQEAWNKMSDVEKKKAVEAAVKADPKTAAATPKKEKKGGC